MKTGRIIVCGIGPGSAEDITPAALQAVRESDVIVGYKYYFRFIEPYLTPGTQCIDTGMKKERDRAEQAFALAEEGHSVCVISSGDAGIYGMTPLIYEMKRDRGSNIEVSALPGISAFQKAASLLGAPIGHDLCLISLSDLLTPWARIEKRIIAAAMGDFVTAVYNPRSHGRYWQLPRLKELFLKERDPRTPVGYVHQAGRPEEQCVITTLQDLDPEQVDMFTVIIIGNSQTYEWQGRIITPRGYYAHSPAPVPCVSKQGPSPATGTSQQRPATVPCVSTQGPSPAPGASQQGPATVPCVSTQGPSPVPGASQQGPATVPCVSTQGPSPVPYASQQGPSPLPPGPSIMNESFSTILSEMKHPDVPTWRLWPLLHAIHTTVDFGMEDCLWMDDRATEILYGKVKDGTIRHIVTDSNMAASGIRKGALERLGIEVHCFVADPQMAAIAKAENITRSQACMRYAAEHYPDALYAVGNAPTALFEICDLTRHGKMHPAGIIAAPVGFVHVCESKHAAKTLTAIPKLIIEGRKGGSNLAATLVNSILTYDDAATLRPGRDLI